MKTKPKKKSIAMLAVPAGICVTALSISVFFLVQITGRMNLSANQNLLTSSKAVSYTHLDVYKRQRPASAGTRKLAAMGTMDMMVAMVTDSSLLPMTAV